MNNKYLCISCGFVLLVSSLVFCNSVFAEDLKTDLQRAGSEMKQAGLDIGHGFQKAAKAVGVEAKEVGHRVADDTKGTRGEVIKGSQDFGLKIKSAFHDMGTGIENMWHKITGS